MVEPSLLVDMVMKAKLLRNPILSKKLKRHTKTDVVGMGEAINKYLSQMDLLEVERGGKNLFQIMNEENLEQLSGKMVMEENKPANTKETPRRRSNLPQNPKRSESQELEARRSVRLKAIA